MNLKKILPDLVTLVESAGASIVEIYNRGDAKVEYKTDKSPLTEADKISHKIIEEGLKRLTPKIPVLSEESTEITYETRKKWQSFWLVDPLDGTKEFLKRTGEFTVNVALMEGSQPVMGLIYVPTTKSLYFAVKGEGAFKRVDDLTLKELTVKNLDEDNLNALISRSHLGEELNLIKKKWPDIRMTTMGSALKFCVVAEGEADFFLRLRPTSEWDVAAGQCILTEAGGFVVNLAGEPLLYNKPDLTNPFFIAFGDPLLDWESLNLKA